MPPAKSTWNEREFTFKTSRSSGPGGQHVNKTETAVRIVHLPSGLAAEASEERSQARNRALAQARVVAKLVETQETVENEHKHSRWSHHDEIERGNPTRVYEGADFKRIV